MREEIKTKQHFELTCIDGIWYIQKYSSTICEYEIAIREKKNVKSNKTTTAVAQKLIYEWNCKQKKKKWNKTIDIKWIMMWLWMSLKWANYISLKNEYSKFQLHTMHNVIYCNENIIFCFHEIILLKVYISTKISFFIGDLWPHDHRNHMASRDVSNYLFRCICNV